jgi:undecaprenyl-phosphate 4-deoxy-4-formamido-L-arabinose transferase
MIDLSVVIPVYRSESTLRALVGRLLPVLDQTGLRHEVVFVDDGSPDNSWHVLRALAAEHPDRITAIQLTRNFGQHNALMCGFRHARGKVIVTMDDDLQNPPEEIPKLLDALDIQELDLVYGAYAEKQHLRWRNAGSALVNWFYQTTFKTDITVTSFRAIRREILENIYVYNMNYTFIDGLLAWNTRRIGRVGVEHHPRIEGRSGYSLGKLLVLALNLFTNFSLLPLQLVSVAGVLAALGGLLMAAAYLILYLTHRITVPGYASTMVAILVLGGVQLLSLGIMGEYLGRLHMNVNRKPQFTVRHTISAEDHTAVPASVADDRDTNL